MTHNPFPEKECLEFSDKRTIIAAEEQKKKFIGYNKERKLFSKFRVDNCLIKKGRKCDFLILDCEEQKAYFIELKGKDLLSAVEQIDHSIDRLISYLADHRINARIVLSKVSSPDLRSTKYIKLERRIKKLKGNLLKKVKILEENL
jgi:hypothetical protein